MNHCTNINHPQIQKWAERFKTTPETIGAMVSLWQQQNNDLEEFPSNLWVENQINYFNKENEINYNLKSINILNSEKAKQVFEKNGKNNWSLEKILTELQVPKEQKQQALQLYSQYLESLNKPNTNPVLQGNQTNIEEIITQLEKDGLLEIDCKGKLKAEDGIATLFEKGGKWEIVTDFKNVPTHKSGGKDISIQGKKVEVEKNELRIENDFGDVAVIPSKYRVEVKDAIKSNCHSCIDGIVESLPKMKDYAGDGTVFPFFGRYKRFKNSLPDNLKNTPEDDYAMRYYWKHNNKPKSFDEAINKEQPMFTMEDDGYYHAPSVEPNTLRFLKPKNHPTLQYELDWYNSNHSDAVDFRDKYDLDTSGKFYRYVPKKLK